MVQHLDQLGILNIHIFDMVIIPDFGEQGFAVLSLPAFELDDFDRDRILQQEWLAGGEHHFEAILAYINLLRNLPINSEFRCKHGWGGIQKSCQDQLDSVFIYHKELT